MKEGTRATLKLINHGSQMPSIPNGIWYIYGVRKVSVYATH